MPWLKPASSCQLQIRKNLEWISALCAPVFTMSLLPAMDAQYAAIGNERQAVSIPLMTSTTSVLDVPPPLTVLKAALEHRKLKVSTPYKPDVWQLQLLQAGLFERYSHIPDGMCFDFHLDFPVITSTQSPPNKESLTEYTKEFCNIIESEIKKGRYIGPLTSSQVQQLIGPFQSSPISIIPKTGRPGRFRIIQNYSFPHSPNQKFPNPSINSYINADNFPSTWGTFHVISLIFSQLPPGSQAATQDVSEAYQTIPLHYSQWPGAVVHISDEHLCIDTCTCFGVQASAGAYGCVADAGLDIFRYHGIGPISRWVDDHLFIQILREHLPLYNQKQHLWHQDIIARGTHHNGGRIGSVEKFSVMALSKNSMKTAHFPLWIFLILHQDCWKTVISCTIFQILIASHMNLEFHGKYSRMFLLHEGSLYQF